MFPLPPGVQMLVWMNAIAFVLDYFLGGRVAQELALWPLGSEALGAPGFMP